MRKPVIEPRRETKDMSTINEVLECEAGRAYANKKQKRMKRSNRVTQKRVIDFKGHLTTVFEMPEIDI